MQIVKTVDILTHQHPQALLVRVSPNLVFANTVFVLCIALTQTQNCWSLWGSHRSTSPACPSPSVGHPSPPTFMMKCSSLNLPTATIYSCTFEMSLWDGSHRRDSTDLEGTHKDLPAQLLTLHRTPKSSTVSLGVCSKWFLNSGRLGAVSTSLGTLFQCPIILWAINLFLISNLNLSFMSFPWILSLVTRIKGMEKYIPRFIFIQCCCPCCKTKGFSLTEFQFQTQLDRYACVYCLIPWVYISQKFYNDWRTASCAQRYW